MAADIGRGTTPTHNFEVDIDLTPAEAIFITYKQGSKTILEKDISSITATADTLTVELTQEDTLVFKANKDVEMQIRARFLDGHAIKSNIMVTDVSRVLKEGVI